MAAPLQDFFSLASYGGGTDEFGNPSISQIDAGNQAGDPTAMGTANLLHSMGAMTLNAPDESGNRGGGTAFNIDYDKLPKMDNGMSPLGWDRSPYTPGSNGDSSKVFDPSQIHEDSLYGEVTPKGNITHKNSDFLDTIGNYMPAAIAAAMSAVTLNPSMLGADFVGGLGSFGAGAFKAGEGLMDGQKLNPLGLASGFAPSIPGVGDAISGVSNSLGPVSQFLPAVMQFAQGKGLNPIQIAQLIARMSGGH